MRKIQQSLPWSTGGRCKLVLAAHRVHHEFNKFIVRFHVAVQRGGPRSDAGGNPSDGDRSQSFLIGDLKCGRRNSTAGMLRFRPDRGALRATP